MLYKLFNKHPVPVKSIEEYYEFISVPNNYIIQQSLLKDLGVFVSTVFTGFSLEFDDTGTPMLFETSVYESLTMNEIFYKKYNNYQEAYSGHNKIIYKIQSKNGIFFNKVGNYVRKE
jgi:hypothetical protein